MSVAVTITVTVWKFATWYKVRRNLNAQKNFESNPQPSNYWSDALSTELQRLIRGARSRVTGEVLIYSRWTYVSQTDILLYDSIFRIESFEE